MTEVSIHQNKIILSKKNTIILLFNERTCIFCPGKQLLELNISQDNKELKIKAILSNCVYDKTDENVQRLA